MKTKNILLKSSIFSVIFSILSIEILFCYFYDDFRLSMFLVRALFTTLFFQVINSISLSKSNRIKKCSITFIGVLLIFLLSVKVISPEENSITRIILSGNILSEDFSFSLSLIGCFILSIIFYLISVRFLRIEVMFTIFTLLMIIYFKESIVSNIFIYFYIIAFFTIFLINKYRLTINILGLFLVVVMAIVSFSIPAPKELPQLSMLKEIKDIINPQKYKLTLDGGSTPTYVSREEASNKVLYTFTGDNPTYFISECYDIITNNEWSKVNSMLFSSKNLKVDYSLDFISDKEKIDICVNLLDDLYSDKEILSIKSSTNDEEIREVEIVDKSNDVKEIGYAYIHPSFNTEYYFNDGNEEYSINGFNRISADDSGISIEGSSVLDNVHISDVSNEALRNTYSMKYKNDNPIYGSKDMYIMKNMTLEKYNDILVYLIKNILNDEEYMKSLTTKEGLEKMYIAINGDYMNSSDDNARDEEIKELYENFQKLDGNIVLGSEDANITYYSRLLEDYYNIDSEVLYDYYDESNEEYFLDNSKATDRMKELALNLTDGEDSTYYKAKAIEKYFKSEDFKYSFDVLKTKSKDPIDYFIFEGKKGYCIQYATSMVLLCRAANIPARYVEGYYITEEDKVGDIYEIKEKNAHAFVQVYIYGYGWKIFDPTPGFYSNENEIENVTILSNNRNYSSRLIYALLIVMGIILSIYICLKLTYRKRRIKYILKRSNEESLEKLILYSIELLKSCNISYEDGETEMEFACKVDKLIDVDFKNCMNKYYSNKYALQNVTCSDVKFVLEVNNKINKYLKRLKKKRGVKDEF